MRIALFVTCVTDTIAPEVGRATVTVLERLGHEVVFPAAQTCCGQMHVNSGYQDEAARLARRFVEVFGDYELIVAPSSSCVGAVRELYPHVLGVSHPVLERVFELSPSCSCSNSVSTTSAPRFRTESRITPVAIRSA